MSGNDSLHILDLEPAINTVIEGLVSLETPFEVLQVVGYEPVTTDRCDIIDRVGSRLVIQRCKQTEHKEITKRVPVVVNISNPDQVALNVVEHMVLHTWSSLIPYQETHDVNTYIASVVFEVPLSEVTENQTWVVEAFLESKLFIDAFDDIQHQLRFISANRWRYWRPIRYGNMFVVVGGKDYRIHTYELNHGRDEEEEYHIDISGPLRYLEERARRRDLFHEADLPIITKMLFIRAIRSEISNVYIQLERSVSVPFEVYRLFFIQIVKPLGRLFAKETIEQRLPKKLSSVVEGRLVDETLVFTFQPSEVKHNQERDDLLESLINQDYVPASLRRHYNV